MRLHDTLSRQLRDVTPLETGHVKLYTCGPTVYARAHIGNFRTFVFEDVLRRWLERRFARVTHVMNLTDVDDKIIRNATAAGRGLEAETDPWIAAFFEDRDTLGIRPAHHYPRATEYVPGMVDIIERLDANGLTYRTDGSVYFHIADFPAYGKLSGAQSRSLVAGASGRIDADEYDKEDARDFALWKAVGADEIGWDTRLGRGRPGWHIECSAMSMGILGEQLDIHCGGVDNIFPHHENEIAQSEGATKKTFAQVWCHSAHLRIGGEKMAKSLGNFSTVHDIVASGSARPSALRYLLAVGAHYAKVLNYTDSSLHMATENVDRWAGFRDRVAGLTATKGADPGTTISTAVATANAAFEAAMDDNLNLPEAMGAAFIAVRDINRELDGGIALPAAAIQSLTAFIEAVDDVLGVLPLVDRENEAALGDDEKALLNERVAARDARDFATSDRLRDELAGRGILVEDTSAGQRWRHGT